MSDTLQVQFTATPEEFTNIIAPATVTLSWQTTRADTVTIAGLGVMQNVTEGSIEVAIQETTTFVLTAFDSDNAQMLTRSVVVTVSPEMSAGLAPPYMIIPYTGSTPPPGWVICDGTDSRAPNLRDRFIVGTGSEGLDSSGADSHFHSFTGSATSALTLSWQNAHQHGMPTAWKAQVFDNDKNKNTNGIIPAARTAVPPKPAMAATTATPSLLSLGPLTVRPAVRSGHRGTDSASS